ncbi:MAG: hypothetical protein CVU94_08115 [Firmicutes bacterium HGW-Firmicutes-19]|jgi:hypothetical protein|nr:MAG: hypothetical protein CVU94_08115 [Firmicutes bacterium HGW-Firmicutes-19]
METIYHCSYISGLKVISSDTRDSGLSEIIGCKNKIASLLDFISKNSNFDYSIGKELKSGQFFVCERYENSIFSTLKGRTVSIYQLKLCTTDSVETCWSDKYVIKNSCEVVEEEKITDLYEYLTSLNRFGILRICRYPQKINGIPRDDQDLVDHAIIKFRMYGEGVLSVIIKQHPHLLERVKAGIDAGLFKEYGI